MYEYEHWISDYNYGTVLKFTINITTVKLSIISHDQVWPHVDPWLMCCSCHKHYILYSKIADKKLYWYYARLVEIVVSRLLLQTWNDERFSWYGRIGASNQNIDKRSFNFKLFTKRTFIISFPKLAMLFTRQWTVQLVLYLCQYSAFKLQCCIYHESFLLSHKNVEKAREEEEGKGRQTHLWH